MSKKVALLVAALVLAILVWQFSRTDSNRILNVDSYGDASSDSERMQANEEISNGDAKPLPTIAIGGPNEDSPATAKIREALTRTISVQFKDEPLNGALAKLSKQLGVNILLDVKRVLDAGGDPEEIINHSLENITFRSVLEIILSPLNLNWEIENEVLLVTTNAQLDNLRTPRVYDVSDLVIHVTKTGQASTDFDPLIDLIHNATRGPWEAAHGEGGSVAPLEADGIHALVVYHNHQGQEGVEAVLSALRRMRRGDADLTRMLAKSGPLKVSENSALKTQLAQLSPLTAEELQRIGPVVASGNQFGEKLFAQLAPSTSGNFILSPYSVSSALTMAYAGAQGETARQMHQVLRLTVSAEEVHALTQLLQRHLSSPALKRPKYSLYVANRLWCDEKLKLLDSFTGTMRDKYDAGLEQIRLSDRPAAASVINDWVSLQTKMMIPKLLGPDDLVGAALLITNAICFEAAWETEFSEKDTKLTEFTTGEAKLKVPMLSREGRFDYAEIDKTQILDMNYKNNELSMLVILPEKGADNLKKLEQALGAGMLAKSSEKLESHLVNVKLPKFQFRCSLNLNDALKSLGMTDAFTFGLADFSAITGDKQLLVTKILHEAFVDADEKGTKAAAATALVGGFGGAAGREPDAVDFIADHPFLFVIRENATGCILFVGRVVNPNAK